MPARARQVEPLSDEEMLDALVDDESPNEPSRAPLPGCSGPRDQITPEVGAQRRAMMSSLLAGGASPETIEAAMAKQFQMLPASIARLKAEVRASWDEEDAEHKPYAKAAATRRLRTHIRAAAKRGAFTAVAMLEKQLGAVEGTAEPQRIRIEGDFRISAAVLGVLGEMDPVEVRQIIDQEIRRMLPEGETAESIRAIEAFPDLEPSRPAP